MVTPIPELVETSDPPLSTDSDAQFDAKAFPWAASLDPFGQSVSAIAIAARENAEEALAAALGGDLPPLTGEALKFLRVKTDESGAEFAEIPEQPTADWETGTSTTESIVSPAKVKAAIDANAGAAPAFILEDQKPEGTAGGSSSGGSWNIRDLNTIVYNPNSVASLSSNEFTVTEDCYVEFSTPAYKTDGHQARIWNITDSIEVARGTFEYTNQQSDLVQTTSFGAGFLTTGKTYRLETYIRNGSSSKGLGQGAALDGIAIYSVIKGWLS